MTANRQPIPDFTVALRFFQGQRSPLVIAGLVANPPEL